MRAARRDHKKGKGAHRPPGSEPEGDLFSDDTPETLLEDGDEVEVEILDEDENTDGFDPAT